MNRLVPCVAALAISLLACGSDPFSTPPTLSGDASTPFLRVHPDGHLWMSYADRKADGPMVARWSGERWDLVGAPNKGNTTGVAIAGPLQFDTEGHPFVSSFNYQTHTAILRKWDGQSWARVIEVDLGETAYPQLQASPAGQPFTIWSDFVDIHVQAWAGGAWKELGSGLGANVAPPPGQQGPAFLDHPTMMFDPTGNPVVAHTDGSYSFARVWVQRWTGTAWQVLGGPLTPESDFIEVRGPMLAQDAQGKLYVAWSTNQLSQSGGGQVEVRRWNGSAWEPLGGPLSISGSETPPEGIALQIDAQGRPVVAFSQGSYSDVRIHLRRWSGTAWEALGGPIGGPQPGYIQQHSMAFDTDGSIVVAWAQRVGQSILTPGYDQVFVQRITEPR